MENNKTTVMLTQDVAQSIIEFIKNPEGKLIIECNNLLSALQLKEDVAILLNVCKKKSAKNSDFDYEDNIIFEYKEMVSMSNL